MELVREIDPTASPPVLPSKTAWSEHSLPGLLQLALREPPVVGLP
jgi:hypothetical protein